VPKFLVWGDTIFFPLIKNQNNVNLHIAATV